MNARRKIFIVKNVSLIYGKTHDYDTKKFIVDFCTSQNIDHDFILPPPSKKLGFSTPIPPKTASATASSKITPKPSTLRTNKSILDKITAEASFRPNISLSVSNLGKRVTKFDVIVRAKQLQSSLDKWDQKLALVLAEELVLLHSQIRIHVGIPTTVANKVLPVLRIVTNYRKHPERFLTDEIFDQLDSAFDIRIEPNDRSFPLYEESGVEIYTESLKTGKNYKVIPDRDQNDLEKRDLKRLTKIKEENERLASRTTKVAIPRDKQKQMTREKMEESRKIELATSLETDVIAEDQNDLNDLDYFPVNIEEQDKNCYVERGINWSGVLNAMARTGVSAESTLAILRSFIMATEGRVVSANLMPSATHLRNRTKDNNANALKEHAKKFDDIVEEKSSKIHLHVDGDDLVEVAAARVVVDHEVEEIPFSMKVFDTPATGKDICTWLHEEIDGFRLGSSIFSMAFDTTSVNSGNQNGVVALMEKSVPDLNCFGVMCGMHSNQIRTMIFFDTLSEIVFGECTLNQCSGSNQSLKILCHLAFFLQQRFPEFTTGIDKIECRWPSSVKPLAKEEIYESDKEVMKHLGKILSSIEFVGWPYRFKGQKVRFDGMILQTSEILLVQDQLLNNLTKIRGKYSNIESKTLRYISNFESMIQKIKRFKYLRPVLHEISKAAYKSHHLVHRVSPSEIQSNTIEITRIYANLLDKVKPLVPANSLFNKSFFATKLEEGLNRHLYNADSVFFK